MIDGSFFIFLGSRGIQAKKRNVEPLSLPHVSEAWHEFMFCQLYRSKIFSTKSFELRPGFLVGSSTVLTFVKTYWRPPTRWISAGSWRQRPAYSRDQLDDNQRKTGKQIFQCILADFSFFFSRIFNVSNFYINQLIYTICTSIKIIIFHIFFFTSWD